MEHYSDPLKKKCIRIVPVGNSYFGDPKVDKFTQVSSVILVNPDTSAHLTPLVLVNFSRHR